MSSIIDGLSYNLQREAERSSEIRVLRADENSLEALYNKSKTMGSSIIGYIPEMLIAVSLSNKLTVFSTKPFFMEKIPTGTKCLLDNFGFELMETRRVAIPILELLTRDNWSISEKAIKSNYYLLNAFNKFEKAITRASGKYYLKTKRVEINKTKFNLFKQCFNEVMANRFMQYDMLGYNVLSFTDTNNPIENIVVDKGQNVIFINDEVVKDKVYNIAVDCSNRQILDRNAIFCTGKRSLNRTINIKTTERSFRSLLLHDEFMIRAEHLNVYVEDLEDTRGLLLEIQLRFQGNSYKDKMLLDCKDITIYGKGDRRVYSVWAECSIKQDRYEYPESLIRSFPAR